MLRPLRDFIYVKPIERKVSNTLLVLHTELPTEGVISAVGPGKHVKGMRRPLDVKVGDRIRFGAGDYLKFPVFEYAGEKYLVLQEADVAGVVE